MQIDIGMVRKLQYQVEILHVLILNHIELAISNLVDNSIKFTKEKGGPIIIGIKDDDSDKRVTIGIIDPTKGIDREMAPRLFTKFATKSEMDTGL
jgi:signal transduction histidine kinase